MPIVLTHLPLQRQVDVGGRVDERKRRGRRRDARKWSTIFVVVSRNLSRPDPSPCDPLWRTYSV